jgi:hypothetical protein
MDLFQAYSIGGDERVNIVDVAVVEGDGAGIREVDGSFENGMSSVWPLLDFEMAMRESCELPYSGLFYSICMVTAEEVWKAQETRSSYLCAARGNEEGTAISARPPFSGPRSS